MGGSSSNGIFTQKNAVPHGPVLALWGIYDPEGSYSVVNADFDVVSISEGIKECVTQGSTRFDHGEAANLIWMQISYDDEATVIDTANKLIDSTLSFLAGCSVCNLSDRSQNDSSHSSNPTNASNAQADLKRMVLDSTAVSGTISADAPHQYGPNLL
uniref:AlNc14C168G7934 protein n=1 Tax=Albugo laibachii Nc14 TaxID=890382 RepID=F0WNA2_9STRA|nr:AlNc14C168G7934 [Albugo laibachii Nc14]|eukprot:CCA22791.1 AlNc14C168G7934 [Albugo laibachii Nc14]